MSLYTWGFSQIKEVMQSRTNAQMQSEALRALTLHNSGLTERQIAENMTRNGMPISQKTVNRRIQWALENYVVPERDQAVKETLAGIDAVMEAQSAAFRAGDPKAATIYLKALALRAKVLGAESPQSKGETQAPPQFNLAVLIQGEQERQRAELSRLPEQANALTQSNSELIYELNDD